MKGLPDSPPTPLEYFAALVGLSAQLPLLEAAASLAQDEYPQLDIQHVLHETDRMLLRLRQRLPADAAATHRLRMLNHYFFQELHFAGNANDFHAPENSYLHVVLQRRVGIPVSLAVLWLELAQALGLQAHGVGFPGHFLVKVNLPQGQVVIDPLTGESLSREALVDRLAQWWDNHGLPGGVDPLLGHFLQAMPPAEILARMLRNLKEIHRSRRDWSRLVAVQNRLLVLSPQAWDEYRDRGLAQAELGDYANALHDLEIYLGRADQGEQTEAIAERVAQLRRALR